MMKRALLLLGCISGLAVRVAEAAVRFGAPFGDGMILQRDRPVPVWGTSAAREKVTVTFGDQVVSTTADEHGAWRIFLQPLAASKEGRVLAANEAVVRDVLVGEVWIASGQSNMELPLESENPRFRDRKGAMLAQYVKRPFIRIANVSDYRWSPEPRQTLRAPISWRPVEPALLQGMRAVSACGFYYALELYGQLDIPIGIIEARWGGTNIDAWTPRIGYEAHPELADVAATRIFASEEEGFKPSYPVGDLWQQPTVLWNEMLEPLCPFAVRGFIWYQGCNNIGEWQRYAAKMHALYDGWAKKLENPTLKLYFVQLAPWGVETIAKMQQEQARFAAEEPNAEIAVINDIGNVHDVHPSEKELVAQRLALHALRRDYGYEDIRDRSPVFKSGFTDGAKAVLTFEEADSFYVYNDGRSMDVGFELAGEDGVFHPARIDNFRDKDNWVTGVVAGRKVILYADGVTSPRKVRYLHQAPWKGAFYNEANLPLGAFEADLDATEATGCAQREAATAWMAGKVGVFAHYLMSADDFARIDAFDVPALVRQLVEMKADYFVLTLGQNTGYYCSPSETYRQIAGYQWGERCSGRDLPREIAAALKGTGIRFGLYLPGQPANRDDKAETAFGFVDSVKWNDRRFTKAAAENWAKVIREWSSRYGDAVSLWWFDGCYDYLDFTDEIARLYRDAARVGNPEAVVAFNEGVRLQSVEKQSDYWAGEENEPFDLMPTNRLRRSGQQWQVLTFLGSTWGKSDLRHSVERWRTWVSAVTARGGAVTLDMNISLPEGRLNPTQAAAFREIAAGAATHTALDRFWEESRGRVLRRLPVDVLPENGFVILSESARGKGLSDAETLVREICARGTYNVLTVTPRWNEELSGADYEKAVRRLSALARSAGVQILADSDPREDRAAFFAQYPDRTLDLSRVALAAAGTNAVEVVCPAIGETLSPAGGAAVGQGVRRVRAFAATVDAKGRVLARRPLAADGFSVEARADAACIRAPTLSDGERLLAVVTFKRNSIDVFSAAEQAFSREILQRLKAWGADGGLRDEYGVSATSADPVLNHEAFLTSDSLVRLWRERTDGRDLTTDLTLLSLPVGEGESALRHRLIRLYSQLVLETVAASESSFYASSKELFGPRAHVAKHPTWQPVICAAEFLKNGLDWWAAPRDWAQTDEMTPVPAALGMAKKFGSPNWLNEGWKPLPQWCRKATWTYAMCGGRMVYHPLCGAGRYTTDLSPREQLLREHLDILNGEQVTAQCRIRLLNLLSDAQPDGEVALVFGHRTIMDWSDPAFEDWGRDLSCRLWEQGFPPDLYPSDELGNGTFRVTEDGWLAVGRETYRVLIARHLDEADRAALEKLTNGRALKTKVLADVSDRNALSAALSALKGAVRQPPIEKAGPKPAGMLWDMVYPKPDGVLVLNDGTKIRIKALDPNPAGDVISGELAFGSGRVTFAAEGVFAARLNAAGEVEALGGAAVRRFAAPGLSASFSRPYDFVLRRNAAGELEGLWQTSADAGEMPGELRCLAGSWRRLLLPSACAAGDRVHLETEEP